MNAVVLRVACVEEHAATSANRQVVPSFGAASVVPPTEPTLADVGAENTAIRNAVWSGQAATQADIAEQYKEGINETDQTLCNVIIRKARVCETALEVLQSASKTDRSTFNDVSAVLVTYFYRFWCYHCVSRLCRSYVWVKLGQI